MANRYWRGGSADWDATAGSKWAETAGGATGFSVPTTSDDVFFDATSGAVTVTVAATANSLSLNFTGFTGTITGSQNLNVYGSLTLSSGMTWSHSGALFFDSTSTGRTITTAGKTISSTVYFGQIQSGGGWTLQDPFTTASTSINLTRGTLDTNNYAVTAASLLTNNTNTRTLTLGSSTVTLSAATPTFDATSSTGLTLNAGTSQLTLTSSTASVLSLGLTFYNVSFTSNLISTVLVGVNGASNTFNNLTVAGRTTAGVGSVSFGDNQTINGTLTLSAGTNAAMRTFVRSNVIGTTRTLTCAAVSATDADFRDTIIAGAAAPASGTRLGDCKGNGGITFAAAKTVYFVASGGTWGTALSWAFTSGGSGDNTAFPLAQDTAVFPSATPSSGQFINVDGAYNLGTIDMSLRTTNTMTLAPSTTAIYGNWINGTGTTLSGSTTLTFAGRTTQTITSAGRTFTQSFVINSPGGSVGLSDAFINNRSLSTSFSLQAGTFDIGSYTATLSGANSAFRADQSTTARTFASGTGTLVIAGASGWTAVVSTGLTVTGTGTISLTSASAKNFQGGGIQTYPTVNQGGAGTITFTGSNKFADITNTYASTGATGILFTSGTTNEFITFSLTGQAGRVCSLGTTVAGQAILKKPSAWLVGANSINNGNNTGLTFAAGGGVDYLQIGYINGVDSSIVSTGAGNFFAFF